MKVLLHIIWSDFVEGFYIVSFPVVEFGQRAKMLNTDWSYAFRWVYNYFHGN